jgi:hypothetical protein
MAEWFEKACREVGIWEQGHKRSQYTVSEKVFNRYS